MNSFPLSVFLALALVVTAVAAAGDEGVFVTMDRIEALAQEIGRASCRERV